MRRCSIHIRCHSPPCNNAAGKRRLHVRARHPFTARAVQHCAVYPYCLSAVRLLDEIAITSPVAFLCGRERGGKVYVAGSCRHRARPESGGGPAGDTCIPVPPSPYIHPENARIQHSLKSSCSASSKERDAGGFRRIPLPTVRRALARRLFSKAEPLAARIGMLYIVSGLKACRRACPQ